MPKVYRDCPQCNKSTLTFVLAGNRKSAENKADWMLSKGHVCEDCVIANRIAENEAAKTANHAAGLAELTGSEKQVAWAETIRRDILRRLSDVEELLSREDINAAVKQLHTISWWSGRLVSDIRHAFVIKSEEVAPYAKRFFSALRAQCSASWWIDHRDCGTDTLIKALHAAMADADVPAEIIAEAKAEATIQPPSPVTPYPVEITVKGECVVAEAAEPSEAITDVMHKMRCSFSDSRWMLPVGPTTGSAEDRAAELAHHLLAKSVPVMCFNEAVREKALNASFQPRYPRWIARSTEKRGCIMIHWTDDSDDVMKDVNRLPKSFMSFGSRQRWFVRAGYWQAIRDFAEIHHFHLTAEAERMLQQAEVNEKARLLATEIPAAPKQVVDSRQSDMSTPGADIHEDLRDD